MPGMNGKELAERPSERIPAVRRVFMSCSPDDLMSKSTHSNHRQRVNGKPWEAKTLIGSVVDALQETHASVEVSWNEDARDRRASKVPEHSTTLPSTTQAPRQR